MSESPSKVVIDGSALEGGGQILRNSVALAALLSKPLSVHKIRNSRQPPGLKNQHRIGLQLAAQIALAHLEGANQGSLAIDFIPGHIQLPGHFRADSITAGSTTLLLQIALPLLIFSPKTCPPSTLTLLGGTNASQAPQVDYTQHVFLPFMRRHFGLEGIDLEIKKRGYYPKGGGEVFVTVHPFSESDEGARGLEAITLLHRGRVKRLCGIAHFSGLPVSVGRDMVKGARRALRASSTLSAQDPDIPMDIEYKLENSRGAGSGIVLWAELEGGGIIGGSAVGMKGLDPISVGEEAAQALINGLENDGCVDEWLQDQIIIFMALARGVSHINCGIGGLTLHTETAIWISQQLTDAKFEVEKTSSGHTIIHCEGIGYTAKQDIPQNPVDDLA